MQLCKHPCSRVGIPFCRLQHILRAGERAFQLWLEMDWISSIATVIKAEVQDTGWTHTGQPCNMRIPHDTLHDGDRGSTCRRAVSAQGCMD